MQLTEEDSVRRFLPLLGIAVLLLSALACGQSEPELDRQELRPTYSPLPSRTAVSTHPAQPTYARSPARTALPTRALVPSEEPSPTPDHTEVLVTQVTDGENGGDGNGGDILLVTPYASESDMASVNEAFSAGESSPWGFEHRGIDFFPGGNLKPFQAVCSGVVDTIDLWRLDTTSNWQVSVRIVCNSTYSAIYAFEPMTAVQSDGESQLANILVSEGQSVAQRDLIGYLLSTGEASHVDFGFYGNGHAICPEPYFTQEARDSILGLIRMTWPGARMCYG